MKAQACPRLFQAEAMRDSRLAGAELAHFERHVTVCVDCLREVQALEALADGVRSGDSARENELHARRERTRLLAAFDRAQLRPERRSGNELRLAGVTALAVLAAALFFWRRERLPAKVDPTPTAIVRADGATIWSEHAEGNRRAIVLERGALYIQVRHSSGERSLVVVLPDGELEDTGTTFKVTAEEGHTTGVSVDEGSVVLRIRGQPPVRIGAGDTWTPAAQAAATATNAVPSALPKTPRRSMPLRSTPAPDPSMDFRSALAALDVGDNAEAAKAFAVFMRKYPRHPRTEDAAYLRVIAFHRLGDDSKLREAAKEYVRRFPGGFRRAEVEGLSR